MAYGQTGSGKTHTMGSMAAYSAQTGYQSASNDGLISRVIDDVFERTKADKDYRVRTYTVVCSIIGGTLNLRVHM